jgi:hypothetical protein
MAVAEKVYTAQEIRYYRTKAAGLINRKYTDFAWAGDEAFEPQDYSLDARVRAEQKPPIVPRPPTSLPYVGIISPYVAPAPAAETGTFTEQVEEARGLLSQPNAVTCQATCIAMATGRTDILSIRGALEAIGNPGDPAVMGQLLETTFGRRYIFDDNASLSEIRQWLRDGEFLITHGWFTGSGHVICLDGVTIDPDTIGYKISVKDPWSEFSASAWAYNNPAVTSFDGDYSSRCLYAAIVAGQSVGDAAAIYARGELDSTRKGAWVHRMLPAKKA